MGTPTAASSPVNAIVDEAILPLLSSLKEANASPAAASDAAATVKSLQDKLEGPIGIIRFLLPRIWLSSVTDESHSMIQGDDALSVLTYLVEYHPSEYMKPTASAVRRDIERNFDSESSTEVSSALLLALAKLLVGPNSENQVGIAADAQAALLALCRWDRDREHCGMLAKRVLSTVDMLWCHLQQQGKQKQRESSTSQMRIAALMIDVCLLGEEEMSLALANDHGSKDNTQHSIMDKLLHVALAHPNDDPLLQVSALDLLENLTALPTTSARADFLLGNDVLRRGLLCLVGSTGGLSTDANETQEWGEADPINGGAALHLLTEICRAGVASSTSIDEATHCKFQLLLSSFQKALHHFHPYGELERLSYIYAVSSLVGSCAVVASSTSSVSNVANNILNDTTLLHEWLSLHSRVSQPKLKATVLCSLSQVMEPSMWQDENCDTTRPTDGTVKQLYEAFSCANHERDSMELILASAKSPFVEERLGAYNMLRALVMRGVCLRLLLLYDDGTSNHGESSFLEWLLNQELESDREGKKAKYQIVNSMLSCNSEIVGGLLPEKALRQLEEWRSAGPNFRTTVTWEMATE